jgi:hypothetical protein
MVSQRRSSVAASSSASESATMVWTDLMPAANAHHRGQRVVGDAIVDVHEADLEVSDSPMVHPAVPTT